MSNTLIIIPACGTASRIGNIPKFLLPISSTDSLLSNILNIVTAENPKTPLDGITSRTKNVWISTRPEYADMMYSYTRQQNPNIKVALTKTMSETVNQYSTMSSDNTIMIMPDTYIYDVDLVSKIDKYLEDGADVVVCVWLIQDYQKGKLGQCLIDEKNNIINVVDKDKNCEYKYAWGCIGWNKKFWQYIDNNNSHIGYGLNPAIKAGLCVKALYIDGVYNDCGTIDEYRKLLNSLQK